MGSAAGNFKPFRGAARGINPATDRSIPASQDSLHGPCQRIYGNPAANTGYSWGPAATRALPSSLSVKSAKFFIKRWARSTALGSHSLASA